MRLSISGNPVPVYFLDRGQPRFYSTRPLTASALSPAARCQLEYLDEGGANIIFRITAPVGGDDDQLPFRLQRKLLRIRKNLPHVPLAAETLAALDQHFRPLFPADNLISHELITLDAGVTALLNDTLAKLVRPRHRAGDFLPQEGEDVHALLVTDMSVTRPGDALVQLKPKWLTQSPNAPPDATRCRTCAVRAQRTASAGPGGGGFRRGATATDRQDICPLDLVHAVPEERRRALAALTPDRRVREFLTGSGQPLFQQLRANQMMLDAAGILRTAGTDAIYALCKAMTLRDCTLFVRRTGDVVEARLGDLDLKLPQRLARWKQMEASLITDGWYTNTEDERLWTQEQICVLSR